ncbi:DUF2231 domain-containing protein [uncultured Sphingomonas sp.]|uniref:DUF2231 domain-containing protein n=1 Tax=uncultured Sphingomonas sp. TaxID=158754 RepID=UPI0035CC952D
MASAAVTKFNDVVNPVDGDRDHPIRGVPSTAAIGGHPIHPIIVPYPIAFLTGAVASDVVARRTADPFWSRASRWLLGAGVVTGLTAGAVGAVDYFTIKRAREKKTGRLHAYGNPLAIGLASASLLARRNDGDQSPGNAAFALSLLTAGLVGVTAWAGTELSYRHMVGVIGANDQHDHAEKQTVA